MNSNNSGSRFYHHFMPKTIPFPSVTPPMPSSRSPSSTCSDHILNLSASLNKHCPVKGNSVSVRLQEDNTFPPNNSTCSKARRHRNISSPPESPVSSVACEVPEDLENYKNSEINNKGKVDMNCNDLKGKEDDGGVHDHGGGGSDSDCHSMSSEQDRYIDDEEDEHMTEIDVDDSCNPSDTECEQDVLSYSKNDDLKKSKSLAFGIDRILSLSAGEDDKDQTSPTSPSLAPASCESPPVVSNTSLKSANSTETSKVDKDDNSKHHHHNHHSILSKLKLCATSLPTSENQRRSASSSTSGLPYFHHPYSPFHHHHLNSIITATSGGGIHNLSSHHHPQQHHHHHHHNHQHPLSHCSECLFLRRYSSSNGNGGSSGARNGNNSRTSIPSSSSSSSANNVATNNMQFSSSMATPCGPTSSAISASFTWMANPSIYDNSAIISPVTGYNQHVPLQPSFGLSTTGFSTLATMQQCNAGGTSGRRKRSWSRAVFSNLQRKGLEKRFQLQKYITKPDRRQLAATLGLTDAQVKVWFQNRRMKWRHSKEGKVSSGTGEGTAVTPSSSPVTSTTSSKMDGAMKDKKC